MSKFSDFNRKPETCQQVQPNSVKVELRLDRRNPYKLSTLKVFNFCITEDGLTNSLTNSLRRVKLVNRRVKRSVFVDLQSAEFDNKINILAQRLEVEATVRLLKRE